MIECYFCHQSKAFFAWIQSLTIISNHAIWIHKTKIESFFLRWKRKFKSRSRAFQHSNWENKMKIDEKKWDAKLNFYFIHIFVCSFFLFALKKILGSLKHKIEIASLSWKHTNEKFPLLARFFSFWFIMSHHYIKCCATFIEISLLLCTCIPLSFPESADFFFFLWWKSKFMTQSPQLIMKQLFFWWLLGILTRVFYYCSMFSSFSSSSRVLGLLRTFLLDLEKKLFLLNFPNVLEALNFL